MLSTQCTVQYSAGIMLVRVQIELQQRGAWWYVKGCTAYSANGKTSISIADEPYPNRGAAIRMMKQIAREELLSVELVRTRRLVWQFVLWLPENPVRASPGANTRSKIHRDDSVLSPRSTDTVLPTV